MGEHKSLNILLAASDNNRDHGAFLSMMKLAELLEKEHGHRVVIVVPYEGSGTELIRAAGFRYYIVRSHDWIVSLQEAGSVITAAKETVRRLWNIGAVSRISKIIREEKIDLVHVNTSWCYVGARAALRCKKPLVWHIREFLEEDQSMTIWRRKSGYRLMNRADRVIAISESIGEKYSRVLDQKKIRVVPNGIDPSSYLDKKHTILRDGGAEFLMVGSVSEGKGQKDVMEACIRLYEDGFRDFTLRIVGYAGSEYAERLKALAAASVCREQIRFEGITDHPEQYYRRADITFMASASEAFGRVTVEAMLGGSLVIGARSAGTAEIIKDKETGLLYRPGDAGDLADRIRETLQDKTRARRIAENGREEALRRFSAGKNAEEISGIYSELCGSMERRGRK